MIDNFSNNKLFYSKINKRNGKTLLKRNFHQFDTSKSNNENSIPQYNSELINPSSISILKPIPKLRKINITKILSPKDDKKYSNETLFSNRLSKGMIFMNKMKLKNLGTNSDLELQNNINIKDLLHLKGKNNSFLFPKKTQNQKIDFININRKLNRNFSNPILSPLNNNKLFKKESTINFPGLYLSNLKSYKKSSKSFDETIMNKKKEQEQEKKNINENLVHLLCKIKERIHPKRKLVFEKHKLPNINKIKKNKSCIHQVKLYNGDIELFKTHLDGIPKTKNVFKSRYKSEKRFYINEGYIGLEVLGDGNNVSFKTDLIENQGQIYYQFSKGGKMDIIEEKFHKIYKDKKEFKKFLEKYNENEALKAAQDKDFQNMKKNYDTDYIITDNIYKDLFHMIFKNKHNLLEMKKPSHP